MKILVGSFQCESNTFSEAKAGKDSFYILHGEEAKNKLFASHLFEEAGFEVVPLVYAVSLPSGMVTRECFGEVLADFKPGAAELAATQIFCMTPGTATNDFSTLPFRHLEGDYYFVKPE